MAGRGELGFIASSSTRIANRSFFGSPGHPSKKGAMGLSQTSKLNPEEPVRTEFTADSIISKRTEWLETQQKRMTATINETRSEANLLEDKLSDVNAQLSSLKSICDSQSATSQTLYDEIQTVYGKVPSRKLMALDSSSLEDATDLQEFTVDSEWVLLVYPMKPVGNRMFMRAKSVHRQTGQLSMKWVLVYEKVDDGDDVRYIKEFSLR